MTVRVLKWDVPVDDRVHAIGEGPIIHVDCQSNPGIVQVWTEEEGEVYEVPSRNRCVTVVGTGHEYPLNNVHGQPGHWHAVGTALTNVGIVWHVLKFIPCEGGKPVNGYIKGDGNTCTRQEEHH